MARTNELPEPTKPTGKHSGTRSEISKMRFAIPALKRVETFFYPN